MIDYGRQRSTVKPQELELTDTKVFCYKNIVLVTEQGTDEQLGFSGYEFDLTEYDKDEYIKKQSERNEALEARIDNTQVALCEVYELITKDEEA